MFSLTMLSCCRSVLAQPDTLWTRTYGGIFHEEGYSVEQTSDGGYIIAGRTSSFGTGLYDVYLIKTDANGDALWARTYAASSNDEALSVQQTSDGGYVVAGWTWSFESNNTDIYVIRTNAAGDTIWTRTYGGSGDDQARSVQQTSDGGFVVTGRSDSFSTGAYVMEVYLMKIDGSGNTLWTRTYGDGNWDEGYSVQQTSDGGYVVTGYSLPYGGGSLDVCLIKTDPSGIILWRRIYRRGNDQKGLSVQQTADGGYVVAGVTGFPMDGVDYEDVYLIRTDTNGDTLWTRTYGGSDRDRAQSIQETADKGFIVAGYTYSFGAGKSDVYLIKTDASGDTLWTRTYGGDNSDGGYSVQETSDGGYIVVGYTSSFGASMTDVWLLKLGGEMATDPPIAEGVVPREISFLQNYPNPFNSTTTLEFSIPMNNYISLSVYDMLGKEIDVILDDYVDPGRFRVQWNASNIPSGIYFLRMEVGDSEYGLRQVFTQTRKMVLLK